MPVKKTLTLGVYFFLWYFFTVVYNVTNKRVLNELPLPATVAVIQIILGIPVFLPALIFKPPNFESYRFILPIICKISFLHALGSLTTVVSLSQGTVSFTHIIKAAEPVFSAIFSAFILGSVFPISVYLTLIPIVIGVGLASVKELSFSWVGFIAGMASNFSYQLRIVYSKKELSGDNNTLSPANLFRSITIISAIELLPISVFLEGYKVRKVWNESIDRGMNSNEIIMNLVLSGFSYYCYNEISFWILGSISPITHAVGNTVKRVIIIFASIIILKSPITNYGILGSTIAIFGTLMYSLAMNKASSLDKEKKSIRV
jgi:solute carrier family 35 protein E1